MMAQSRAESTRDTYNYGQYINQFPPNTIKVIREFERIQKKICRHKMSIMFNEICINEEMLPKYTYINIYIAYEISKTKRRNKKSNPKGEQEIHSEKKRKKESTPTRNLTHNIDLYINRYKTWKNIQLTNLHK